MASTDLILECFRAIVLLVLVGYLWNLGKKKTFVVTAGWKFIQFGFLLILFGTFLDITDNFESLNPFIVVGNTETEAFLEKVVGYLLGFIFLTVGLIRWGPSVEQLMRETTERKNAEDALQKSYHNLEQEVEKRTSGLQKQITEREQTEEAFRKGEERFREYFELGLIGMAITSLEKGWIHVNDKLCEILGYPKDELIKLNWAEITYPDDLEADVTEFNRVLAGEIDGYSMEKRFIRKDGEIIITSISAKCLRKEDGSIDHFVALIHDITNRKQAEESRETALMDAERANQAKTEFLATMSHEFRTPLNAILGFSEMLRSQYFGPLGAKNYKEYANDIHESGEQMLALINDILDISAIEAGKRPMTKEAIDINELLAGCIKNFEYQAVEEGIDLSLDIAKGLPLLFADKRSVIQVVLNLLSNAIKFTDRNGAITVSAIATDQIITITFNDTGMGIPPDKLPNITEPFSQGHSDPHVTQDGTGLGLSIAKSLVETNGGELSIKSEVEKGTIVAVTLPAQGVVIN
jgi:PAS domain S-box-containing protein